MTIGTIILIVSLSIVTLLVCIVGGCLIYECEIFPGIVTIVAAIIIGGGLIAVTCFWQMNTESGKRALKDQQSNLDGGISRTVTVYDFKGAVLATYTGEFDIETDRRSYILFDDENDKRHIIYYTTGTVIIDEN